MDKKLFGLVVLAGLSLSSCLSGSKTAGKTPPSAALSTPVATSLMMMPEKEEVKEVSAPTASTACDRGLVGVKNIRGQCSAISTPVFKESGLILSAEFIYWKALQDGLEFVTNVDTNAVDHIQTADVEDLEWQFKPGFRAGVGYVFGNHDAWDVRANWTHLHSKIEGSDALEDPEIAIPTLIPTWGGGILGISATEAEAKWNLKYNVVDLEVGRDYFVSKALSLRPHMGFRYADIKQHYTVDYTDATIAGAEVKKETSFEADNDFKGFGLRSGAGLTWNFTPHFGIVGQVSGSLLAGKFDVSEEFSGFQGTTPTEQSFVFDGDSQRRVRANIEAQLGFAICHTFAKGNWMRLFVGYDVVNWFDQNALFDNNFITTTQPVVLNVKQRSGNLSTQGATAKFEFKF